MEPAAVSSDVIRLFGPLDDHVLAEILATRATVPELVEARERLWTQNGALREGPPRSERVVRVMALLADCTDEEAEADEEVA